MKQELLYTAHLDSETGAIIITPGDREVRIQDEKPAAPDYSHLIGKWVRCIKDLIMESEEIDANQNHWYIIIDNISFENNKGQRHRFGGDNSHLNSHGGVWAREYFDLSNPRDTNPDEEEHIVQFDAERMGDAVRFQTMEGREVKCVVVNDVDVRYPVTGYIEGDNLPEAWTLDGFYHKCSSENSLDLLMVIKGGAR